MKYAWVVAVTVALMFSFALTAEADISEGFDNYQNGVRPLGWSFFYCGQDSDAEMTYFGAAAPSVTLDRYGDMILTPLNAGAGGTSVQFWMQALAANPSSALQVREYDGSTWATVTMIYNIPSTGVTYGPLALNPSTCQQVEFTYKDLANGTDLYIDDVVIVGHDAPVAPTATPTPALVIGPTPVHLVIDWDDYDADGDSDLATYDPATGNWNVNAIATDVNYGGGANDIPCPGDYDGDGIADLAYFDASAGTWYAAQIDLTPIINGETHGAAGDIPAPGDYDGDHTADLATYRPSDGIWRIKDITAISFLQVDGAIPVPGDYDGDGTTDTALAVPSGSMFKWEITGSANRFWGIPGDIPMPMDYDGNGITDIAVYRPSNRTWYVRGLVNKFWGAVGDSPAVADVNADGAADLVQYRSSTGWWWYYGASGAGYVDYPATGDIVDGATSY